MQVDPQTLADRVRAKRRADGLSLRAAASALEVSPATLSRVESGTHLPERKILFHLANWVGLQLDAPREQPPEIHPPDASTVEAIALHLRADPELQPDDAEMLVDIMQTAYQRLRSRES